MKAIILSGGKGTRLRPLTDNTPKPMLPIGGVPHLEHIVDLLKECGFNEIIFSTGYLHSQIQEHFGDGSAYGVKMYYKEDGDTPLGTAGAIKNCEDLLDDNPFVVFNGDILTNINLDWMYFIHCIEDDINHISIALTPVDNPSSFGVAVTKCDKITRFVEKPTTLDYGNLINAGIYIMNKEVLKDIPKDEYVMVETDVFPQYAEKGKLYAYPTDCYWIDIGTHERYNQANEDIAKKVFQKYE
jgi:NDP-sugar pyrophosphorylase family protein